MARSAKDLRDIINMSKLSIQDYSSDNISSEDDSSDLSNYLSSRPSSAMGASSFATVTELTRPGSLCQKRTLFYTNFNEKGFRPNTEPAKNKVSDIFHHFPHSAGRSTGSVDEKKILSFPSKYMPIPPITNNMLKEFDAAALGKDAVQRGNDFDRWFQYLDGTIIGVWLQESNNMLNHLNDFVKTGNNFVELVHFFLTNLPFEKYCELLDLEFSIIMDQLNFAFQAVNENLNNKDLRIIMNSVLKEYPKALNQRKNGIKLLLDIISIFCSDKDERYRKLLQNIKCSTQNKQTVKWLLALRAFGLISFVSGVLKFFENVLSLQQNFSEAIPIQKQSVDMNSCCIEAVRKDYSDVVDYLIAHQNVEIDKVVDNSNRNLIFIAAIEGNIGMMHHLSKLSPTLDIDKPSTNGNTPLHFVISKNDIETATGLLDVGANVNMWNTEADGATPLHTAVMLGEIKMVELLLQFGADKTVCMGVPTDITPFLLAEQLNHADIAELLKR